MNTNYSNLNTNARLAARDIIRTKKVGNLMSYISTQKSFVTSHKEATESIIERYNEQAEKLNKALSLVAYELRMAIDTQHPDLEAITKRCDKESEVIKEEMVVREARHTEALAEREAGLAATVEATDKKIAEYEEKIEGWNKGERKVNREEMLSIADGLAKGLITNAFVSNAEFAGTEDEASA